MSQIHCFVEAFAIEEELALLAATGLLLKNNGKRNKRNKRNRRRRSVWVRKWLLRRPILGAYERLMLELRLEDEPSFTNFLRVEWSLFEELLSRVGPRLKRKDTAMRKSLDGGLRLAITLRYLATGNSYKSLQYEFRVAHNTISLLIPEVCEAVIQEYLTEVMPHPATENDWKEIASEFSKRWNFHNTIGAIDGKHIAIRCPPKGGSMYFNYKGFHSIVLLALTDANYRFLYIDVGANGNCSDGGIFKDSDLFETLQTGRTNIPSPEPLPNENQPVPYFVVGDDAFPLRSWLMKPYPRSLFLNKTDRIFNYRLSRARRVVENTFGILAHRFRCLLTTMQQHPSRVRTLVMACCVLHNLIRTRYPSQVAHEVDTENLIDHSVVCGSWRDEVNLLGLDGQHRNTSMKVAKRQRDYLRNYYNSSVGQLPWQESMI